MTTLTFLGSMATGWHYLMDGLAGFLLAGLVYVPTAIAYRELLSGEKPIDRVSAHGSSDSALKLDTD
jgi:hypothetical protein